MTYDHELTLISITFTEDDIGNQIPTEVRQNVLCQVQSIGRNEFYNAAIAGHKPEISFVVHAYEYHGQQVVEFDAIPYNVIRTFQRGIEELELTCERKIGNG